MMTGQASRFWMFSLAVYANAAVRAECLDLQDRYGIDLNLLLFCAYIGAEPAVVLPPSALEEAAGLVADWHGNIVRSLRTARRALKPFAASETPLANPAAELRCSVNTAELDAERLEQMMLEAWSAPLVGGWPRAEPEAAVAANIRALFRAGNGPTRLAGLPLRLIAAARSASAASFPRPPALT